MEVSEALCEQNIACEASAASGEWIRPFKPNKPREVAVCRVKRGAMFQRNCGDNSIHDKWATGLALAHQAAQDFPMALRPDRGCRWRVGRAKRKPPPQPPMSR